jgi:hypothetical protein
MKRDADEEPTSAAESLSEPEIAPIPACNCISSSLLLYHAFPGPDHVPRHCSAMDTSQVPYLKPLAHRGFVHGSTISNSSHALCHFFGGVRYALPPAERWRKALRLPPSYSYGSRERPGQHDRGAGVCPQPGFLGPPDESHWSEDCFQCNVWLPVGEPPVGGWPVLVYIRMHTVF